MLDRYYPLKVAPHRLWIVVNGYKHVDLGYANKIHMLDSNSLVSETIKTRTTRVLFRV